MSSTIKLIASPGISYLENILQALKQAHTVTLITAFASPAGVLAISDALHELLSKQGAQASLLLGLERQGFNTNYLFEGLLTLKENFGNRLELGVVAQDRGILHAKAILAEGGPGSPRLIIGSANLTRQALGLNHELGVNICNAPPELTGRFRQFVNTLNARRLKNDHSTREWLHTLGLITSQKTDDEPKTKKLSPVFTDTLKLLDTLPKLPALIAGPEEHLANFMAQGFLVGQGRGITEALVIRLPIQEMTQQGIIRPERTKRIGKALYESQSLGYVIRLLPQETHEKVTKAARKISSLRGRLVLKLPCFGHWMPESFWNLYMVARAQLLARDELSTDFLLKQAHIQKTYLESPVGRRTEINELLANLREKAELSSKEEEKARGFVDEHLNRQLSLRSPETMLQALKFRTGRQRWAPFEQTETPYRQLMADLLYSVLGGSLRTGDWPRRFTSFPARQLAEDLARGLENLDLKPGSSAAMQLLCLADAWEWNQDPFDHAVDQFRKLIPDDLEFEPPSLATLLGDDLEGELDNQEE
jgi:HKD family nuclease